MQTHARLAAPLALALLAGGAHADHFGYWVDEQDFYVRVSLMPDFDQKRDVGPGILGLPADDDGDGGGMYCVPTSAADLLGYVKTHGYTDPDDATTPPSDIAHWNDFTQSGVYNQVTSFIGLVGLSMNTDPQEGTSNANHAIYWGIRSRLDQDLFDVNMHYWSNQWAPTGARLGAMMREGGILMFCYGRYVTDPSDDNRLVDREGGHCVALTKVDRRPFVEEDHYTLNYANPSNSSNTWTQAEFKYAARDTLDRQFDIPAWEAGGGIHIATEMLFDGSEYVNVIDSAYSVMPKQGMTSDPGGGSLTFSSGQLSTQIVGAFETTTLDAPGGGTFIDAEVSPDRTYAAFLSLPDAPAAMPCFYKYDGLDGGAAPEAVEPIPGAIALAFGRGGTVYVLTDTWVIRYNLHRPLAPGASPELARARHGALDPAAIAYDDATDAVLVLDDLGGGLINIDRELEGPTLELPLQGWAPGPIAVLEVSDGSVVTSNGLTVDAWAPDPAQGAHVKIRTYTCPTDAGGVSAGGGGDVYVWFEGENTLKRLEPDAGAGYDLVESWRPGELLGLAAHRFFHASRSRTNFEDDLHSGPGWENIPTDELPAETEAVDCMADYAPPFGVMDFSDVIEYLTHFAAGNPNADLAPPLGQYDFSDVIEFLTRFASGCP